MAHTYLQFYISPLLQQPEIFKQHIDASLKECTQAPTPLIHSQKTAAVYESEYLCFNSLIETGVLLRNQFFLEITAKFISKASSMQALKTIIDKIALNFAKLKSYQPLVDLIEERIKWLENELGEGNRFSWKMKDAILPEFPVVETFLRSEEKMLNFSFLNINSARQFVNKYTGIQNGFSTYMYANGTGKNSYVTIAKTNDIFTKNEKGKQQVEHIKLKELISKLYFITYL